MKYLKSGFVFLLGLFLFTGGGYLVFKSRQINDSWRTIEGVIYETETRSARRDSVADKDYLNQNFDHELYIRYSYSVAQQTHISSWKKVAFAKTESDTIDWTKTEDGALFTKGNPIDIRFDPENPKKSELHEHSFIQNGLWGIIIGLFTMLGGFLFFRSTE